MTEPMARRPLSVAERIFEALRAGLVPAHGLATFAVGMEQPLDELARQLDHVERGGGAFKFLRGDIGCGKTFCARLALEAAQKRRFVTSFVVLSDTDLCLHNLHDLYRRIVQELSFAHGDRLGLTHFLHEWRASSNLRLRARLTAAGESDDPPDFSARATEAFRTEVSSTAGKSLPVDLARAVQAWADLYAQGQHELAAGVVSWSAGSESVGAAARRAAGVKGDLESGDALAWLAAVVEIIQRGGRPGLVIVVDELETLLRARGDVRSRSYNALRQILDATPAVPGLMWMFTGTPTLFDAEGRGVASLQPLHDRIKFQSHNAAASLRQPQLELKPFDADRLKGVTAKLRDIYPARDPERIKAVFTQDVVDRFVSDRYQGLQAEAGIIPRLALRDWVEWLDIADANPGWVP